MNPEEIEAWFYDHPGEIAYICVLLGGCLISFIALIVRINDMFISNYILYSINIFLIEFCTSLISNVYTKTNI